VKISDCGQSAGKNQKGETMRVFPRTIGKTHYPRYVVCNKCKQKKDRKKEKTFKTRGKDEYVCLKCLEECVKNPQWFPSETTRQDRL